MKVISQLNAGKDKRNVGKKLHPLSEPLDVCEGLDVALSQVRCLCSLSVFL